MKVKRTQPRYETTDAAPTRPLSLVVEMWNQRTSNPINEKYAAVIISNALKKLRKAWREIDADDFNSVC